MYYVVESDYIGPNRYEDAYADESTIEIRTSPATDINGRERINGELGTVCDFWRYAHGEYETLEEARAAIEEIFGDVRERDLDGHLWDCDDDDVVAVFKPGEFHPIGIEGARALVRYVDDGITADTTDEQIAEIFDEWEEIANNDFKVTLPERLYYELISKRDWLRKQRGSDEDEDEDDDEDDDEDEE